MSAKSQHASVLLRPRGQWSAGSERCDRLRRKPSETEKQARSSAVCVPEQTNGGVVLRGALLCHLQLHQPGVRRYKNQHVEGIKNTVAQHC